ncbi:hypothetical protein KY495_09865 [Massilia sp. PAMC28688]|uniref:hypothetical protein n=1 Tax=Massilia sp. PAMC28688 TaxID=2861283 RepID=UPI001C6379ED|nr:hypothetical protein [Massilia sp. PAMC28688]QYF95425.1 hypothetical protein KY495_09865 [Massilia sp. PAMC28688]
MQRITFLTFLFISAVAEACPSAHGRTVAVMAVPNVREAQLACHVRIHLVGEQCGDASCVLKPVKHNKQEPTKVTFSCIPLLDQSGFENPSSEMKVTSIKYRSGNGHLGVIDYAHADGDKPAQDILFCLNGTVNRLCGNARVDKVKGKQPPEVKQIQELIKRIDFTGNPASEPKSRLSDM